MRPDDGIAASSSSGQDRVYDRYISRPTGISLLHQPEAAEAGSLSERAYYRIRELIVTLELPPGSVVDERALMQRLELGRTPVREALRALARERLVVVYPRRGMVVAGVDAGALSALAEVRAVLEPMAARLAAVRATAADRTVVGELLGELARVAGGHDERALIELDQRIHRHVYRCAHNPYLEATLNEHYVLTLRIWFLALDRVARLDAAVGEHGALLEAIRDRDPAVAEAMMRYHIEAFESAIRSVL
ncbi:MAG: GntR family transcriptional regulator [Gaiellales bacterium]